jgi:hypothetical protein
MARGGVRAPGREGASSARPVADNVHPVRAALRWSVLAATGLVALSSAGALAATPAGRGVRIDQTQPASPDSPFFRAEGPHEPQADGVEYALGLTLDYAKGPLRAVTVDASGDETQVAAPVETAMLLHVGASLSPARWLAVDLDLPIGLLVSGDVDAGEPARAAGASITAPSAPAVGDLRAGLHLRAIDGRAFGLFVGGRFWAPIGSEDAYLSDKQIRGEVDLGFAGDVAPVLYGCTLFVSPRVFFDPNGDRAGGSCALHAQVAELLSVGVEPTVAALRRTGLDGAETFDLLVEPMGAARLRVGGLRVGVGAGPGFGGAAGTAEVRALFSVAYAGSGASPSASKPGKSSDSDTDGIPDERDACPDEAGPTSKDPAKRGCPSLDRDGDDVRDDEDWCPERTGIPHEDPKANGCPDGDNDGLPDTIDTCPVEPGPLPVGCPKYARLVRDQFRVDPPIAFSDSSLTPIGKLALEEIAATIRANPKIELLSVALGTKGRSNDVADQRARNLMLVFRAGNLDTSRYEVVLREDLPAGLVHVRVVR